MTNHFTKYILSIQYAYFQIIRQTGFTMSNNAILDDTYRTLALQGMAGAQHNDLIGKAIIESPYGCVVESLQENGSSIVFVNRAFERITGYRASECLGLSCSFLLKGDNNQESLAELKDAISIKKQCTQVVRNYKKDGSLFYNELSVTPVHDQQGKVTHLIWNQNDVTSFIEKEHDLSKKVAEMDERYSSYIQHSNEALWRLDFHPPIPLDIPEAEQIKAVFERGKYSEANDVAAKIYGHKQGDELIGHRLKDYVPDSNPENVDMVTRLVRSKFHMKNGINHENNMEGDNIVTLNNITPAVVEGTISHLWGASLDVTELFSTKAALEKSEIELTNKNISLEEKHLALKELITYIELEKKEFIDRVAFNISQVALPSLEKIRLNKGREFYIDQHRENLENLTSSYGQNINSIRAKLTPREMEICSLVKNGHSNKEVAELLDIALHTVEKHRRNARKKLGIRQKVNLHSYLNSL